MSGRAWQQSRVVAGALPQRRRTLTLITSNSRQKQSETKTKAAQSCNPESLFSSPPRLSRLPVSPSPPSRASHFLRATLPSRHPIQLPEPAQSAHRALLPRPPAAGLFVTLQSQLQRRASSETYILARDHLEHQSGPDLELISLSAIFHRVYARLHLFTIRRLHHRHSPARPHSSVISSLLPPNRPFTSRRRSITESAISV